MLEFVKEKCSSMEWLKGYCLGLICFFAFGLPIFGRISLSYILTFWLLGALVQKNILGKLKGNWDNSKAYRSFFVFSLLFVLALSISLLYSDNQFKGLKRLESHLSLLVIPFGLFLMKPTIQKNWRPILWAFVLGNSVSCLICWGDSFFEYFSLGIWNPYYVNFSNFLHPSYFALYLAFSVLFIWEEKLKNYSLNKFDTWAYFYLSLISIFSITIVFLSSKAGIFAFAGMIFFLLGIRLFNRKNTVRNLALIFLLLIGSCFVLKNNQRMKNLSESIEIIQNGESNSKWTSTTCRFYIWESALESLEGTFLLGHGIGDSRDQLVKQYAINEYEPLSKNKFDAHNQYLEILLICGFGGLFLVLLKMAYSLFYAWKENDALMLGFIVLMGIHLMVETMFTKSHGIMFYAFFIHLLWIRMDCSSRFTIIRKKRINKARNLLRVLPTHLGRKAI